MKLELRDESITLAKIRLQFLLDSLFKKTIHRLRRLHRFTETRLVMPMSAFALTRRAAMARPS
jgi:hypothetical protein